MFDTVLVISSKQKEWLDTVESALAEVPHGEVQRASNYVEAKSFVASAPDLVIADLNLANDANSGVDPGDRLGLDLLERWHRAGKHKSSILLSDVDDNEILSRILQITGCEILPIKGAGTYLEKIIPLLCKKLLRQETSRTIATMELQLFPDTTSIYYKVCLYGSGSSGTATEGSESIKLSELDSLLDESNDLDPAKNWHGQLQRLGEKLFHHILPGSCLTAYSTAVGSCGGEQNLRLRFTAERKYYPVAFEALHNKKNFLMLDTVIARRVPHDKWRLPTGVRDGNPINILVVISRVGPSDEIVGDGYCPRNGYQPEELENLAGERRYFEQIAKRCGQLGIGKVKILPADDDTRTADWSLSDLVREEIISSGESEASRYHVIHFAGHSYFDRADEQQGFLLFAGKKHAQAVAVSEFAGWFSEGRSHAVPSLVYFSSCKSSSAEAAFEMARVGIPAVLGFRWDLQDDKAVAFAQSFYDRLLGHRNGRATIKLCFAEAFTEARRDMRGKNKQNCIWAAPILILQTDDWHQAHVHPHHGYQPTLARAGQ